MLALGARNGAGAAVNEKHMGCRPGCQHGLMLRNKERLCLARGSSTAPQQGTRRWEGSTGRDAGMALAAERFPKQRHGPKWSPCCDLRGSDGSSPSRAEGERGTTLRTGRSEPRIAEVGKDVIKGPSTRARELGQRPDPRTPRARAAAGSRGTPPHLHGGPTERLPPRSGLTRRPPALPRSADPPSPAAGPLPRHAGARGTARRSPAAPDNVCSPSTALPSGNRTAPKRLLGHGTGPPRRPKTNEPPAASAAPKPTERGSPQPGDAPRSPGVSPGSRPKSRPGEGRLSPRSQRARLCPRPLLNARLFRAAGPGGLWKHPLLRGIVRIPALRAALGNAQRGRSVYSPREVRVRLLT